MGLFKKFSNGPRRTTFVVCFILILMFAGLARGQQTSAAAFRFANGHSAVKIPFELYNDLIFVRLRVNRSSPLWFVLDTGAEISVVKQSRARSLGLQFDEKGNIEASGGSVDYVSLKNVSFRLPGVDILNPSVVAFPLESFEPLLGRTADGILGADLFNRFVVEIHYADQTINLYDPRTYRYYGRGEKIPITIKENSPFVEVQVTHSRGVASKGSFEIDTGSDSAISFNRPFARTNKLVESTTTIETTGLGAGGSTSSLIGRVDTVSLGRFTIKKPIARFSKDEKGELASDDFSGLVGGGLLRRFDIVFDYSKSRIILEPNIHFNELDEFNMSGASFSFEAPDFKVLKVDEVMKNSPASEAGLIPGDIVLAIDGKPASALNGQRLRQMLKLNNKNCLFEINRGGRVLRKMITLRRLI